ncbi:MAG: family 78 glycoside hydrolase catalytic domain [Candidatus Hydrogenedentes bacterium]|nr:family 78 glycoside hydrolase catalytic domain [Candidatus Hydrogenedentota bacterium]
MRVGSFFLLLTLLTGVSLCAAGGEIRPERLECEGMGNPVAVDEPHPVLSWSLPPESQGAHTAWQVQAASSREALLRGEADLWDSGRVGGAEQQAAYAGAMPAPAQQVHWRVREWGTDTWSEPAAWGAGLPRGEAWRAKWITAPADGWASSMFRRSFTVQDKPVARAVAFVCGLGQFECSVNGAKAGDHFLDPGWSNYRKTCLYVPFDVTAQLRPGENVVGVMLGNGMYNVPGGRYTKFKGTFGPQKLIMQLHVRYADGTEEVVATDNSWRAAESPITFTCIYGGEDYDARRERPGWDAPGYDDAAWAAAKETEGPGGELRLSEAPPVKVLRTLRPAEIRATAPGEYFVNLGENLSAVPFFTVRGAAGAAVTVTVGELPDTPWEGHSYTYTLKGEGDETFRPRFTYFGFQYLFLKGAVRPEDAGADNRLPLLLDVGADFVSSAAPEAGSFWCDNALMNEINDMVARSVRSNLQSVLTDCPHREKLGWLEVSHLMGPSILYHYDAAGLYRKICRDTTESQLDSGLVPDIAPEYTRFNGGFFESAEWGSACVQLPWLLCQWEDDTRTLDRQYDTMAKYTRHLASTRNEKGLARGGLGDWYDWTPEKGHAGASQLTPDELTATAFLHDNARILAETSRLLDRAADAEEFADLAARVRGDFLAAYYHPDTKSVATGSQSSLAVGLFFGLVPEADRDAVLANLVKALEDMQFRPTTGEVCFRYLVRALADAGRSDLVWRIVNRTDPPGYGCMLKQHGLKTLSERWDKPGESLNHCMFGHIQEWFQAYVLGIRQAPDSRGFARLLIAPTPVGDLAAAKGHFDSPRGRVAVEWRRSEGAFTLSAAIPGNTAAEIVLPVPDGGTITVDGGGTEPPARRGGEGEARLTVGSGNWVFTWKAPGA